MAHFMNSLRALLAQNELAAQSCRGHDEQRALDPRKAARLAWLHQTAAAWQEATRRCDAAWDRNVAALPDDFPEDVEIDPPPEQAEVDALHAQLNDVIQKDLWPAHLYFGCI
jgi:hypothetical protein